MTCRSVSPTAPLGSGRYGHSGRSPLLRLPQTRGMHEIWDATMAVGASRASLSHLDHLRVVLAGVSTGFSGVQHREVPSLLTAAEDYSP